MSVQIHLLELVVLSMRVGNPSFFAPLNRAVVAGVTCTRRWRMGVELQMTPTDAVQVCEQGVLSDLAYCLLGHAHLSLQGAPQPCSGWDSSALVIQCGSSV